MYYDGSNYVTGIIYLDASWARVMKINLSDQSQAWDMRFDSTNNFLTPNIVQLSDDLSTVYATMIEETAQRRFVMLFLNYTDGSQVGTQSHEIQNLNTGTSNSQITQLGDKVYFVCDALMVTFIIELTTTAEYVTFYATTSVTVPTFQMGPNGVDLYLGGLRSSRVGWMKTTWGKFKNYIYILLNTLFFRFQNTN